MAKMQAVQGVRFGPYRLGGPHGPLERRSQTVKLPPKALAVLWHLVTHAGQVVTKEDLLAAVWAGTVVGEEALTTCLRQVRRTLGDDVRAPRYIATVHRVGYRFLAPITSSDMLLQGSGGGGQRAERELRKEDESVPHQEVSAPILVPRIPTPALVGREAELTQLHSLLDRAWRGERQLVFVTGEAGIGKTALIEAFLGGFRNWELDSGFSLPQSPKSKSQISKPKAQSPNPVPWITQGQCIEHYGAGEAYLPVLEALSRLCRQAEGEPIVRLLRRVAPSWLVQLPALLREEEYAALQQKVVGATRGRMLREMAEALEAISATRPLVLVLEDVHWSDASTIDLLSMLARRREAARVLVLATSRQAELVVANHPLKALKQELIAHRQATEILLGGLQVAAVQQYVGQRCAEQTEGAELAALVYRRTEGHPLFMVQMTDYLAQHHERGTAVPTALATLERELPQGLRELIEEQVGRLTADEQRVLEAGSVAGAEFTVASVAAGVAVPADAIETVCEHLAQRGQFIEERGLVRWPDGALSGRYGFRHALYQEVVYQRLGASRRVRLHRQIGEREEVGYGERASEIAAELAMHFEHGQDKERAVRYLQQAGENALRRNAYPEAIALLTHELDLLATFPPTEERAHQELQLQLTLGPNLIANKGQSAVDVEHTYTRALNLCHQLNTPHQRVSVLAGLRRVYAGRGNYLKAQALSEELLELVQQEHDPALLVEAHYSQGNVLFWQGEFVAARTHLTQAFTHDTPQHVPTQISRYGTASGLVARSYASLALVVLGYLDQAKQHLQGVLIQTEKLAHPLSWGQTLVNAGIFHHLQRQAPMTQERTEALITLCRENDLLAVASAGMILRGWALVAQGRHEDGSAQLQQGMAIARVAGIAPWLPYFLLLQAESYGTSGQPAQGLQTLDEAWQIVERTGGRCWCAAELWRLKGELTLQQLQMKNVKLKMTRIKSKGPRQEAVVNPQGSLLSLQPPTLSTQAGAQEAEGYFLKAIEVARQQQAKSLELRATVSLARLWRQQGKVTEAHQRLSEIYGWFTEGFDTKDLQEAKALLAALS